MDEIDLFNKKIMQNPICKYCNKEAVYNFSAYPNSAWEVWTDPKYKFHIGIWCLQCNKWSNWVQQAPDLMDFLTGAILIPKPSSENDSSRIKRTKEGSDVPETTDGLRTSD